MTMATGVDVAVLSGLLFHWKQTILTCRFSLLQLDDNVPPGCMARVDRRVNAFAVDCAEANVTVVHIAGSITRAVGMSGLQLAIANHDIQKIGRVTMQTGRFTGCQAEIPDPHSLVLEQEFRADGGRDGLRSGGHFIWLSKGGVREINGIS